MSDENLRKMGFAACALGVLSAGFVLGNNSSDYDPREVYSLDFNGDGRSDFVVVDNDNWRLFEWGGSYRSNTSSYDNYYESLRSRDSHKPDLSKAINSFLSERKKK